MSTEEPIICNSCLADSGDTTDTQPQITINKVPNGIQCKICTLPSTLYHFRNPHSRTIQKTTICYKCAKQRNACQCCVLDMTWHVSLTVRDKLVSYLQNQDGQQLQGSMMTPEATNVMMKRYLALQKGKLGGAQITSDSKALDTLLSQGLEQSIATLEKDIQSSNKIKTGLDKDFEIDIKPVLAHLPLTRTLQGTHYMSFFLYNIDSSIPEWKIKDSVTSVVGTNTWCDRDSNSIIVNHRANAGGIKFANQSLADKFVRVLTTTPGNNYIIQETGLMRGVLMVDRFKIFVVPWESGFSTGSFGATKEQSLKLARSLRKLIVSESQVMPTVTSDVNNNDDTDRKRKTTKKINNKKKKDNKKGTKRVTSLQL